MKTSSLRLDPPVSTLTKNPELQLSNPRIGRLGRIIDHAAIHASVRHSRVVQDDVGTPGNPCSSATSGQQRHRLSNCCTVPPHPPPPTTTRLTGEIDSANEGGIFDHLSVVVHNHLEAGRQLINTFTESINQTDFREQVMTYCYSGGLEAPVMDLLWSTAAHHQSKDS